MIHRHSLLLLCCKEKSARETGIRSPGKCMEKKRLAYIGMCTVLLE